MTGHRPFLDANVLFSAAWSEASRLHLLWELERVELIASEYVIEEARRNLDTFDARARLKALVERVRIVPGQPDVILPRDLTLREKDRPVLAAAMGARATHLITGDRRDFGPYLGRALAVVLVLTPAAYLSGRAGPAARHRPRK